MKIYVPNLEDNHCYVVLNSTTIREYYQKPYNPNYNNQISIQYRDYFYNSNYLYQDGFQNFSSYSTLPVCLDKNDLTTDFYYRNDIADILIIFVILAIFIIYLPYKIFSRFFGRWLKL